jgi:ABC-type nitrate/sulfonate/bicarbonate transport system substrate-binding protein
MMPRMVMLLFVCWLFAGEDATAAQPVKVRISYSSRSNSNTLFQVAVSKGFPAEEGMEVELIQVNPRLGLTAVIGGDRDFTTTFGTTLRAIIGGFPIKFVGEITDQEWDILTEKKKTAD